MQRTTVVFRLSSPDLQRDLLDEFSRHQDVEADAASIAGAPIIRVTVSDAAAAMWEVRATVGAFDDLATEIVDQECLR